MSSIHFLKAEADNASELSVITKRSKAYWGYTQQQIELWEADLTISEDQIGKETFYKAVKEGQTIGYYSWYSEGKDSVVLDNLFVLPEFIGQGVGALALSHFLQCVRPHFKRVVLYSDPHAEQFYARFGFTVIGKKETSVKGRFMPIMEKIL